MEKIVVHPSVRPSVLRPFPIHDACETFSREFRPPSLSLSLSLRNGKFRQFARYSRYSSATVTVSATPNPLRFLHPIRVLFGGTPSSEE